MKLFKIFKLIKTLFTANDYVICYKSKNNDDNYIYSDNIDKDWLYSLPYKFRNNILNKMGEADYVKNLQKYDIELYNTYKEIEYQIAKSEYFEAAHEYYRLINDPNSGSANKAYMLFERLKQLEQKYKSFEND